MELTADCSRCVGLCCVVLPFARSADFAFDKPAGTPCRHLTSSHRCHIHDGLVEAGMRGCVAYDCFGAGQAVTASGHLSAFVLVEQVHELAWYLTQAGGRGADVTGLLRRAEALAAGEPTQAEVEVLRADVVPVLDEVAAAARAPYGEARDLARADLAGADLRGEDLRGADLRGALLIGADLSDADLTDADLLGADLRGADLARADLTRALYLTRRQLASARSVASSWHSP